MTLPVAMNGDSGTGQTVPLSALPAMKDESADPKENKAQGGSGTGSGTKAKISSGTPLQKPSGTLGFSTRGWRTEINTKANGTTRFWLKRRGRGSNRQTKYGGMFRTLSPERMAQYEANRKTYAKRKQNAQRRKKAQDNEQSRRAGNA